MEQQKSSRDSLQYSSGYSTQTNTPSCSEDTIPSQGITALITHDMLIMNYECVASVVFPCTFYDNLCTVIWKVHYSLSSVITVNYVIKMNSSKKTLLFSVFSIDTHDVVLSPQVLIMSATLSMGMLTVKGRQTLISPPPSHATVTLLRATGA